MNMFAVCVFSYLHACSFEAARTFGAGFISWAINRADVIIFGVVDSVVKGHCLHNVRVGPGSIGLVVLHAFHLGA